MINFKNKIKKSNKILNFFLIVSTLFGATIFSDKVKASTPDVCKDVFGAKDSSGKYSKNKNEIKSITYFCSDTPDRFEITIYEIGLCIGAPFSKSSTTFNKDSGNCSGGSYSGMQKGSMQTITEDLEPVVIEIKPRIKDRDIDQAVIMLYDSIR